MAYSSRHFLGVLVAAWPMLLCCAMIARANDPPSHGDSNVTKPPTTAELRKSIAESLPYITKYSDRWLESRGCISCHVVSFSIWSNQAAKQKGFSVDQKKIDEWIEVAHSESPELKPAVKLTKDNIAGLKSDRIPDAVLAKLKPIEDTRFATQYLLEGKLASLLSAEEMKTAGPQIVKRASRESPYIDPDTYGQLFLGDGIDKNLDKDWAKRLTDAILSKQQPDGLWPAGGQLPGLKRPKPETNEATTMWLVLALAADPDAEARAASTDAANAHWPPSGIQDLANPMNR